MKNFNRNCFDSLSPEKKGELGSHETLQFQENAYYLPEESCPYTG